MTHEQALQTLLAGNQLFAKGETKTTHRSPARRQEIASGQHPLAIVVTCSDSRVVPELIFDQGLGDLFVVRTAGEVVDNAALGSIEYAASHLHVPLLIVLGHKRCGAVDATLQGGEAHGHLVHLVSAIAPAVEKARAEQGDVLNQAICNHVAQVVEALSASQPILAPLAESGALKIIGAYYDLDTGLVELL